MGNDVPQACAGCALRRPRSVPSQRLDSASGDLLNFVSEPFHPDRPSLDPLCATPGHVIDSLHPDPHRLCHDSRRLDHGPCPRSRISRRSRLSAMLRVTRLITHVVMHSIEELFQIEIDHETTSRLDIVP